MFESIAQGFAGFALFVTQLVAPQEERLSLSLAGLEFQGAAAVVRTRLSVPLDPQVEKLIDAGVPLRMRFTLLPAGGPGRTLLRTLRFNVGDYTYAFIDSTDGVAHGSKSFATILLALRAFGEFEAAAPRNCGTARVRAEILPSRVERLRRTVDMSRLFGRPSAEITVQIREGKKDRGR